MDNQKIDNSMEKVIDRLEINGARVEVVERQDLKGCISTSMAFELFYAKQQGMKIRYVKITTNGVPVMTESGALYYYRGSFNTSLNKNLLGSAIKGAVTKETLIKPVYNGRGIINLEPSFKYYLLIEMDNSSIIIDKSLYYASIGNINLSAVIQRNVSSALLGQEGLFQLQVSGTGILVLEMRVPESEIECVQLRPGEELKVDGNFVILRDDTVDFTVTKSNKGLLSSAASGEGLLNTYKGTGRIWVAPTLPIYRKIVNYGYVSNKGSNSK